MVVLLPYDTHLKGIFNLTCKDMFATRDEALAMASRFFGNQEGASGAFLVDEKGFWLSPIPPNQTTGLLSSLQGLRPRLAGWIRMSQAGDQHFFTLAGIPHLFVRVAITAEPGPKGLGIPLSTTDTLHTVVQASDQLIQQVKGIAFITDGKEARSRGSLSTIQGSGWEAEGWIDLCGRLSFHSVDSESLYKRSRHEAVRQTAYSLALCQRVQITAGQAGQGVAGWFRLQDDDAGKDGEGEVFRGFTYLGNPLIQWPIAYTNPAAIGFSVLIGGAGRTSWIHYLHALESAASTGTPYPAEFETGQSFYTLQIHSTPVFSASKALVGHHHIARFLPDPSLQPTSTVQKAIAEDAYADAVLLTQEANHRIKNSLSMAASLLQLQSYSVEDAGAKAALTDAVQRMYTVSELHEALYKYTVGVETVKIKPFIETIAERLRILIGGRDIELRTQIDDIELPNKTASRIGFLVNELVLNAVKYAFSDSKQGFIAIYLTKNGNTYYLSVQDNGQGMEQRVGATESLGSTLIAEFAKDLQAEMRLETQAGTRYVFTFA
jgi:two-component sensor histidine kinase